MAQKRIFSEEELEDLNPNLSGEDIKKSEAKSKKELGLGFNIK